MTNLLIHGCCGKMGMAVANAAMADGRFSVAAGVDIALCDTPFPAYTRWEDVTAPVDVAIDFTRPAGLETLLTWAVAHKAGVVVATTGLQPEHQAMLSQAARSIPILQASNLSIGVNLLADLVQTSAAFLGDDFNIEITETHHNQKVDAPSGTALTLAEAARGALKTPHRFVNGRHSADQKREPAEIGIHALRGGSVVGTHCVHFFGMDESIELTHTAQARPLFARGALRAAEFLTTRPAGLYTMRDMLLAGEIVTALHVDEQQAMIHVSRVPADTDASSQVFDAVAHINLDMITQSLADGCYSLSFTCGAADADAALAATRAVICPWPQARVDLATNHVKLTLEGRGMPQYSGIAAKAFRALAERGIIIRSITTSETKISCLVPSQDSANAIAALRGAFELKEA